MRATSTKTRIGSQRFSEVRDVFGGDVESGMEDIGSFKFESSGLTFHKAKVFDVLVASLINKALYATKSEFLISINRIM
jgi:hypothetical protein